MALVIMTMAVSAHGKSLMDKYTPTMLEWIVMRLNAESRSDLNRGDVSYRMAFAAVPPDTIKVIMVYGNKSGRAALKGTVDMAIERAKNLSKTMFDITPTVSEHPIYSDVKDSN
jgi:hypothetical protein